jgi:TonB family protein
LLGTLLFHLIILLILGFTALRAVAPEEDGGILVNFGNVDAAAGTFEPRPAADVPSQPAETPPQPVPEDLQTQDTEESVAIAEAKKKEEQRRKEEEERRKREEAIRNRVAGAFGSGGAAENSQGDAPEGAGNQGNPFGNSDQGANTGVGGYGSFNLSGRSLGAGGLPRPDYTVQVEGRIVLNITVDPNGNVIFAEIGRGTNIDNDSMRKSAREAARRAKFNQIDSPNNQSGTITYIYKFTQ